jgi:hypothetical protein
MTLLERAAVRHGHPRHIIVAYLSFAWLIYFLWVHNWLAGSIAVCAGIILGRILTLNVQEEVLGGTTLGKIMLLHLHPLNLSLQLAGLATLVYGVWFHSGMWIMLAMTVIMIGHMWGWHKVNEAL